MKCFIDTADLEEIKLASSWGIIDGVTTNPSLIKQAVEKRSNITIEEYIIDILKTVSGPVSLEVIALKEKGMIDQARTLYEKFSPYGEVVIKIPVNSYLREGMDEFAGLKTINQLTNEGIPVNVTLVMTPEQALLAAKAGATYVSPFAGRIDDYIRGNLGLKRGVDFEKRDYLDIDHIKNLVRVRIIDNSGEDVDLATLGHDNGVYSGVDLVKKIKTIFTHYGYKTEIIAASIRNARQVRELAELGVHIATIPFNVLKEMIHHPKTIEGMRSFTQDIVPAYEAVFR